MLSEVRHLVLIVRCIPAAAAVIVPAEIFPAHHARISDSVIMPPDAARIITPRKIALMTTIISNATQHNGAKKTAMIPKPKIVQSRNTLLKNVRPRIL